MHIDDETQGWEIFLKHFLSDAVSSNLAKSFSVHMLHIPYNSILRTALQYSSLRERMVTVQCPEPILVYWVITLIKQYWTINRRLLRKYNTAHPCKGSVLMYSNWPMKCDSQLVVDTGVVHSIWQHILLTFQIVHIESSIAMKPWFFRSYFASLITKFSFVVKGCNQWSPISYSFLIRGKIM